MATRDKLWEGGHDESVEVNQRALIDKILARYSGEFTVFRELLQNSDDAQSKTVEIRFHTQNFVGVGDDGASNGGQGLILPDLKTTPVYRWLFKNDGVVFRDEDWSRLKKIAEGNPDEQKIGAFGVGFYSLFSVTEEPFVTSGDQWMGFYWKDKKDQLFARRGRLDHSGQSPWTSFEMVLREPSPIPPAFDFARFLASSITFMTHLEEVSVHLDNWCLVKLNKSIGSSELYPVPRGLSCTSPNKYMTVSGLKKTPVTIRATIMNWVYTLGTKPRKRLGSKLAPVVTTGFFSSLFGSLTGSSTPQRHSTPLPTPVSPTDLLETSETSIILSVFSADVNVRLNAKLSSEIYRSTKKNPPSSMKYELIYTAKDKYDASKQEESKHMHATGSIFQGLRADLDGTGAARVFIGHATAQTTGIGGHMSARFIPTVEREAIDFMDRNVAVWNRELLYVGGLLARAAYQMEMDLIHETWNVNVEAFGQASLPEELRTPLNNRGIHTLKFFTFHESTPSVEVSAQLESAFFRCSPPNDLPVVSTLGIRNASQIRLPDPSFTFLKQFPLVPVELTSEPLIILMQNKGIIRAITFDDVLTELKSRPLPEDDVIACIKWWISLYDSPNVSHLSSIRTQLLEVCVLVIPSSSAEDKVLPLHNIKTVLNQRVLNGLPLDGPLPPHTLPVSVSKHFPLQDLKRAFSWADLTVYDWLNHICDPTVTRLDPAYDIELSPKWAEKVLSFVARNWSHGATSKQEIIDLLKVKSCIPTSSGMKRPDESYFTSADIFHDLPIVKLPSGNPVKGSMEKLLQELEVRKHVDLQIIFNRMIKTNEWTINDLTRYLVSVKSSLKEEEVRRLRLTAAFPKETPGEDEGSKLRRLRADQLYEPLPVFRQLGLPIIDWGRQTKWRSNSEEAQFLFALGLRRYPPLEELIQLCANTDIETRSSALKYLTDNIHEKYADYNCDDYRDVAFIPALDNSTACLGTPSQVFSKPEWSQLGFLVIHPNNQTDVAKLQIKEHPTTNQIVELLQRTRPADPDEAKKWFNVLSIRVSEFTRSELLKLSGTAFIPAHNPPGMVGPTIRWLVPTQCYLGQNSTEKFHSKLFIFVNFGAAGNAFLTACGAKQEPSVEEVAKTLLDDPHRFYELARGPNNFLNEMRNIAVNRKDLSFSTIARMKKAPVLLCYQRKLIEQRSEKRIKADDLEDEEWEVGYDLKAAEKIVIADDTNAHQVFGIDVFTAPQEDIIEGFYIELGSRRLSSLVKEEYLLGTEVPNSRRGTITRALILERLPIFLHEHNHARMRVSLDWLQAESNFRVRTFGHIKIKKALVYGDIRLERQQEASAAARRGTSQRVELLLADNAETDMYEVAMCLNRFIFDSPKAHDALLFMTILSTDLRALKRRGYNVDRILRQRRLEKQAEEARIREENIKLLSQTPLTEESTTLPTPPATSLDVVAPTERASSFMDTIQKFKRKVGTAGGSGLRGQIAKPDQPQALEPQHSSQDPIIPGGFSDGSSPEHPTGTGNPATSLNNIASNIERAIKACRAESNSSLQNLQEMRHVKEIENDGYCDISGHAQNMRLVGSTGHVKVFVGQDVSDEEGRNILTMKSSAISRFIQIMTSLAQAYNLSLTNLHMFYDTKGVLIAFNRNGSIFLNLRYYEAWHDKEVRQGNTENALISWYFTLAHEIAHNLVQPHNSEHEFYFSAICERYLVSFCRTLLEQKGD